ncbi:SURF1-domain-containing protein [Rickenella mellea]|uniref:SURF1-like protein n=1 Tax=Rickenella mellea TaxID=50990 RepID=A0A4Y7QKW0_9AGAM|nr:SURF1-domain-containing protein [Rickenella mellea]
MLKSRTSLARHLFFRPHRAVHNSQCLRNEGENVYRARQLSWLNPTLVIVGFVPIFTLGLGVWQVQRLKWKVNLIDELQEKLDRDPMSLPNRVNMSAVPDFTFRKVCEHGRWDHAHTVLLGPRPRDGVLGYQVITPLMRPNGTTILVDRGFIAKQFADLTAMRKQNSDNQVEVLGMLRVSQSRNAFTPENKPGVDEWHWVDVDALAQNAGGAAAGVQPVYIEEIFEGHAGDVQTCITQGTPIGRPPNIELRNQHATYAVTWFSLSAVTSVLFASLLRRQLRSPASKMPRR